MELKSTSGNAPVIPTFLLIELYGIEIKDSGTSCKGLFLLIELYGIEI